jgi:hypothetical protein
VIKYLILKEKFEYGGLITRYVTEGKEDEFTKEYKIILEIHPTNLEKFLYFWQQIRNIKREEYRLWISNLSIYLVQYRPKGQRDSRPL